MSNNSVIISATLTEFDQMPNMNSLSNNLDIFKLVIVMFGNAHKNTFQSFELISKQYQY